MRVVAAGKKRRDGARQGETAGEGAWAACAAVGEKPCPIAAQESALPWPVRLRPRLPSSYRSIHYHFARHLDCLLAPTAFSPIGTAALFSSSFFFHLHQVQSLFLFLPSPTLVLQSECFRCSPLDQEQSNPHPSFFSSVPPLSYTAMSIEGAAPHQHESMPAAASPSPIFPEADPFVTYNAAFRPALAHVSTEASQAMPSPDTDPDRVRTRTSRSFSGISDVKNGIGLRLRRASTSIKTVFASASKYNARETDVPARKHSVDEHAGRRGTGGIFRRRRSEATATTAASSSLEPYAGSSQTGQLEPPHVPYDAFQGSAARAFAARENVRLAIPKTIVRRDSNIGLLHEDRDRESGIHISVDTYDLAESSNQSQIQRRGSSFHDPYGVGGLTCKSQILFRYFLRSSCLQSCPT